MLFTLILLSVVKEAWCRTASVTAQCDNIGTVYLSQDSGDNFKEIATEENWRNAIKIENIEPITSNTILRFLCVDYGVIGGFIATIDVDGTFYSTTEPINDGNFEAYGPETLIYTENGEGAWKTQVDPAIGEDAFWIWNTSESCDPWCGPDPLSPDAPHMVFEFNFANILTPSPTSCFNVIHDWTIDDLGQSSQFRLRSECTSNQFLKIKMKSLIEYDSDGKQTKNKVTSFASNDWYWNENVDTEYGGYDASIKQYVSKFNMNSQEVEFNLTTILFYEDGHLAENEEPFFENSLKWNKDVRNWPFLNENNKLKLCIDLMTNKGSGGEDDDVNSKIFTWNDFDFKLEDKAFCNDEEVDIETQNNPQNQNHREICFIFNACDGVINYDPFVRYNYGQSKNMNELGGTLIIVSLASLVVLVLIVFIGVFYHTKHKKLQQNISLVSKHENDENNTYDTMVNTE